MLLRDSKRLCALVSSETGAVFYDPRTMNVHVIRLARCLVMWSTERHVPLGHHCGVKKMIDDGSIETLISLLKTWPFLYADGFCVVIYIVKSHIHGPPEQTLRRDLKPTWLTNNQPPLPQTHTLLLWLGSQINHLGTKILLTGIDNFFHSIAGLAALQVSTENDEHVYTVVLKLC